MLGFIANKVQGSDNLDHSYGSFYELSAQDIDNNQVNFSDFKGKVVLIVNVASKWGLTDKNYKQLVQIHSDLGPRGLEILGFPCNQFLNQEPGSPADITAFVSKYGVKFRMMAKVNVNGPEICDVYKYLKTSSDGEQIDWNFAKYLVSRDGQKNQALQKWCRPQWFEERHRIIVVWLTPLSR